MKPNSVPKRKRPTDRYKLKNCPTCDKEHRKKGPYCSQACANSDREVSDNVRDNMRKVAHEFRQTPEGIAQMKMIANTVYKADEYAVGIPDVRTLDDYDEFLRDYQNGENW